ncbi:response regulator [Azospirillum sp. SYSU D00513]|uniref:response regulator n=1 Tax=Azospirillum sp. SYSU D00513 TaxID=2812561 RepID=UPI0020000A5C|nr:response regulator [Azospirillum sp. SYSU D00513]
MTNASMPSAQRHNLKILVVDDNPLLQSALRDMLALWGVGRVVSVGAGEQARELLRRERFDLMVTDWLMEPVSGGQLLYWVRQSPGCTRQDLPVIVLTGNADLATVRAAWDAGADTVLAKPITAATLIQRIEAVLSRRNESGVPPNVRSASQAPEDDYRQEPRTATFRLPPAEPPPQFSDEYPALSAGPEPLRLPPPSSRAVPPSRERIRLLLAVDRLEKAIARPDAIGARLRHALSDLQLAANGDQAAQAMVASLATCVTWVDADGEGFADALQAHAAALRWAATCDGSSESRAIARALLRSLRATVRALALNGSPVPSVWPDARPEPPAPDQPHAGQPPVQ